MPMIGKIRRMFYRDRLTISEISRRTSLSRMTIRKWLNEPEPDPKYERSDRPSKLSAYKDAIVAALQVDARRPHRDRRTAKRLYQEFQAQGYPGGYTQFSQFIAQWRKEAGTAPLRAFVPLKFDLGEAFQFDWSEETIMLGGVLHRLQVAHMKLCASKAYVIQAYPSQGHEMLFDAHTKAFLALGGIPRRGIYDNMKTAVDQVRAGKSRKVNTRFSAMASHYLFDPDFCNVASGWEKGIVEKNVQDRRRELWQEAIEQRFPNLEALNHWLLVQCRASWERAPHPEHPGLTISDVLEIERPALMPVPTPFDGYVESMGRVSSTCLVIVARNRYSVPCEWAGQLAHVHLNADRVVLISIHGELVEHARVFDRGQTLYDWQHYIPLIERKPGALRNGAPFADLPKPLTQLRQVLIRRPGGDQIMSKVLACVPRSGLEAVLVAAELVLESGSVNAEHIQNVLARLKDGPVPAPIETHLTVAEAPTSDMGRYDQLRCTEVDHV